MDNSQRRPVATPSCSVPQSGPHQILVCKACKHHGQTCEPAFRLLKTTRAAIAAAGLGDEFEVSGTACLAGCVPDHGGPCVIGVRATAKATWLFGDIDPAQQIINRLGRVDVAEKPCRLGRRPRAYDTRPAVIRHATGKASGA